MEDRFPILGRWRIVASDDFDTASLDCVSPAFVMFRYGEYSEIGFGAFEASLSAGYSTGMAHFRFDGADEGDEASGEGWAELQDDGTIRLELTYDRGDEVGFTARRWTEKDGP